MIGPESDECLIGMIYDGVTNIEAFEQALGLLAARYRCLGASMVLFDSLAAAPLVAVTWGSVVEEFARRYEEFKQLDPAPKAFAAFGPGRVSTTTRVLPADALKQGAFVNEFYYPLGLRETLGTVLFADASRFGVLGLFRGPERDAFDDGEIADLQRFTAHLIRAAQLWRAFGDLEARSAGLEKVLERLTVGIVLLDPFDRASFVNQAANAIFSRGDGLSLDRNRQLVTGDSAARSRLNELIAATRGGSPGGVVAVRRSEPGGAYAVLVAPAAPAMTTRFGTKAKDAGVVLLVHDPLRRVRGIIELLQSAFGFRPHTAKLVAALLEDDNLKTYAEREGISIHTARFHLHAALAATDTRTQVELIRLVIRTLRDLTLYEEDSPAGS